MSDLDKKIDDLSAVLIGIEKKYGIKAIDDEHWVDYLIRLWEKIK